MDAIKATVDRFETKTKKWVRRESHFGGEVDMAISTMIHEYGPQVWPYHASDCPWLDKVQLANEDEPRLLKWERDEAQYVVLAQTRQHI